MGDRTSKNKSFEVHANKWREEDIAQAVKHAKSRVIGKEYGTDITGSDIVVLKVKGNSKKVSDIINKKYGDDDEIGGVINER